MSAYRKPRNTRSAAATALRWAAVAVLASAAIAVALVVALCVVTDSGCWNRGMQDP